MTSYFEKLTSINTSSLSLLQQATSTSTTRPGNNLQHDLTSALDKIEQLKSLNSKLELDLKCEHDEKAELVTLKVGLENEVLNLREVNDRLEFQVEQLRVEKDKIHNVLANVREDHGGSNSTGLFIAGNGNMKKFPSMDDLSYSPSTSPTNQNLAAPSTPGAPGPLERITEEDETLLESLVLSSSTHHHSQNQSTPPSTNQQQLQDALARISQLESENARLSCYVCSRCKRTVGRTTMQGGATSDDAATPMSGEDALIFEHDDEGLVLCAVDEDDDGFGEENHLNQQQGARGGAVAPPENINTDPMLLVEMQRKIIEKLEQQLDQLVEQSPNNSLRREISLMKRELEVRMRGIVLAASHNSQQIQVIGRESAAPNQHEI